MPATCLVTTFSRPRRDLRRSAFLLCGSGQLREFLAKSPVSSAKVKVLRREPKGRLLLGVGFDPWVRLNPKGRIRAGSASLDELILKGPSAVSMSILPVAADRHAELGRVSVIVMVDGARR
jgi:hypothetical protein